MCPKCVSHLNLWEFIACFCCFCCWLNWLVFICAITQLCKEFSAQRICQQRESTWRGNDSLPGGDCDYKTLHNTAFYEPTQRSLHNAKTNTLCSNEGTWASPVSFVTCITTTLLNTRFWMVNYGILQIVISEQQTVAMNDRLTVHYPYCLFQNNV